MVRAMCGEVVRRTHPTLAMRGEVVRRTHPTLAVRGEVVRRTHPTLVKPVILNDFYKMVG